MTAPKMPAPTDEASFCAFMELMDADFATDGIPIIMRQLHSLRFLAMRCGIFVMFPFSHKVPREGEYQGTDLAIRAQRWFEERYGDATEMDFSPGSLVVYLRGDAWTMRLPFMAGPFIVVCHQNEVSEEIPPGTTDPRPFRYNALDALESLPDGLRASLTGSECSYLRESFVLGARAHSAVHAIWRQKLIPEVRSDLDSAVAFLASQRAHTGQAQWASSQAVEKSLKALLVSNRAPVPKTHSLAKLLGLAAPFGLSAPPKHLLSAVACSPAARYGEESLTLNEAIEGHHASLCLIEGIAKATKR